jgi:hypothetical protein
MKSALHSLAIALLLLATAAMADWPAVRGGPQRTGLARATLAPPFHLSWARHWEGERLGTAMEPVVADGKVFVNTHNASVYALDAQTGQPLWRFGARGAFLQSPAYANGLLIAASTDGNIYAIDGATGALRWSRFGGDGGFSASPTVSEGSVYLGTRMGQFLAVDLKTGQVRWRQRLGGRVRQTAAASSGRVYVTAEDLRAYCMESRTGSVVWTSPRLMGQTARDYYPVLVRSGKRLLVVVRTNPATNMAQRLDDDRHFLLRTAAVDESDWTKVEAWVKSDAARGNPASWQHEQVSVIQYLKGHPDARTFFVLDAATGKEALTAPVLWGAGCQGVGAPPAVLPNGKLLVFYRSAFGNWSQGIAPLVALGVLDLERNRIAPLQHASGAQPPGNTFSGTGDESQSFQVAGNTALIVHQGTLSGLDLKTRQLFPIWGERDTYGGFRNLPWARNEWRGPARGGVAVVGNRIYWQTGSRILCITAGEEGKPGLDVEIVGKLVPGRDLPKTLPPDQAWARQRLAAMAGELLARRWAPLYIQPGLAGREFFFDDSGELFEALAWAYPHLSPALRDRAGKWLAEEWVHHPPFTREAWYPLGAGERRERFPILPAALSRLGQEQLPHPFGNVYAVALYAERCGEWGRVLASWEGLKRSFDDFAGTGWRLDPAKGDLYANRYLASLLAFARIAERARDTERARRAAAMAAETKDALSAWWMRSSQRAALPVFKGSAEMDPVLSSGDALFFAVFPHRQKPALFHDLTPEVAQLVNAGAPGAPAKVWASFQALCPTWHLAGEERQVHTGENFIDGPDFGLDAFKAADWLATSPPDELARRVDLPFSRADASYLTRLALLLDRLNGSPRSPGEAAGKR